MPTPTIIPPHSTSKPSQKSAPQWQIERIIATIGRFPTALGKFLDRLARMGPPVGWIVKFFSSVPIGIAFLVLTGMYIAVGSGFASLRASLEMTDLQFFDAWPMVTLLILLATSLTVVTLRKIPFTVFRLGVWTVHIGILIMLAGCFIYFSQKIEGMTRIFLGKTVNTFYDSTERALYIQRFDPADHTKAAGPEIMVPLPTLPIFNEHLTANPNGTSNPLNMSIPADQLSADPALKPLALCITGYYPFANMDVEAMADPDTSPIGHEAPNPAVRINAGASPIWRIANSPANRLFEMETLGFEYLYHPATDTLTTLTTPTPAPQSLIVRIPKLNIMRAIAAVPNEPIAIEGTPYTLTPRTMSPVMQVVSKGYEGAFSANFIVDIQRKDADKTVDFQRFIVIRYPERSPDFILVDGKPKRIQGRVDNDIDIVYVDATKDHYTLVQNADDSYALVHRKPGGEVESKSVKVGDAIGSMLTFSEYTPNAVPRPLARIVPNEHRPMAITAAEVIQYSAIDMRLSTPDWSYSDVPVPFIEYADTQSSLHEREPTIVNVPRIGPVRMILSTIRRPLPAPVTLTNFELERYPHASMIADYRSTIKIVDPQTHGSKELVAHLNSPAEDHGLYLFQARWDGHDEATPAQRYTELGVGNRPGISVMVAGAIMIIAGVLYSFYIKPLLLNRRKAQLAAFAKGTT